MSGSISLFKLGVNIYFSSLTEHVAVPYICYADKYIVDSFFLDALALQKALDWERHRTWVCLWIGKAGSNILL